MLRLTRRQWMECAAAGLFASASSGAPVSSRPAPAARQGCTLSFGTYGMRSLTLERAITAIAALGYDGIEIAVAPGFEGEPARMSPGRRREVRRLLVDRRLKLTALMENLAPATTNERHQADLDRLRRVMELGHD